MKSLLFAAAAALALAGQASPGFASQTGSPTFTIVPLSTHVAVVTSKPGCNAEAAFNGTPYYEMPEIASAMGIGGTSAVKIDLASNGDLLSASLFQSSGNRWLDDAAMRSAKLSRYIPETIDCHQVAGSYLVDVDF